MATDTDNKKDQLNPSARDYEDSFNKSLAAPDTPADLAAQDQRDAAMRNSNASQSVASAEKQAIGDTTAGKAAVAAAGVAGGTVGSTAAKILGKIKTKKGGAVTAVITTIILVIVALVLLAPTALLMNLKENGHKWMTRYTNIGMDKRTRIVMEKRYFSDPGACTGIKIKCRFTPGLSDAEISKLKNAGLISDGDIGTSKGKKFLRQMTFSEGGKLTTVTKDNFRSFYGKNLAFSSKLRNIVAGDSILSRGHGALKKLSFFGVDRKSPLGESGSKKTLLQKFRERFYGNKNSVNLKPGVSQQDQNAPGATADRLKGLDGLDQFTAQANELSKNAVIDGPKVLTPDTSMLTQADPAKISLKAGEGAIKGALMGFLAAADTTCTIFNTLRITNYAAKAFAAAALIKYSGLFLTIADKQKDNKVSGSEVELLASTLLRPSSAPGSQGKDFSQSQGASLIFNGKVSRPEDLGRFSNGTTAMAALGALYTTFNFGGKTTETCRAVKSWWGQATLIAAGLATTILSFGVGAISGAAMGIAKAMALAYITQVLITKLVPIIAGTVAPDPATDPEGGYGAGNAIAAGMGAMGAEFGKAVGMRPLTDAQAIALGDSSYARQIAATDAYERSRRNIFGSDNPYSIQNSLAVALSPLLSSRSLSSLATNFSSLIGASFSSPFQLAYAAPNGLDAYGGKFCAEKTDEVITSDPAIRALARDANCNLIYGANPATLTDASTSGSGAYSIDSTIDYMATNGHIDPSTGEPKASGDPARSYPKFLESCRDSTDPIVDKYSADLEGSDNPALCYEDSQQLDYYRTYTQYINALGGVEAAAEDRLGVADASTAGGQPPASLPTPTNAPVSGEWKLPLTSITVMSEWAKQTGFGVHKGIDLQAAPGTPVYAVHSGEISTNPQLTKISPQCSRFITIKADTTPTLYLNYQHLDSNYPAPSGRVAAGQQIGVIAPGSQLSPSCATGPHLHFQIQTFGDYIIGPQNPALNLTVNPRNYLPIK